MSCLPDPEDQGCILQQFRQGAVIPPFWFLKQTFKMFLRHGISGRSLEKWLQEFSVTVKV
jgi:hypothetical protein